MRRSVSRLLQRAVRPDPYQDQTAVVLPEPLAGQVRDLLAQDRRTDAVRLTRQRTGLTLLPAVRAVDALTPTPPG